MSTRKHEIDEAVAATGADTAAARQVAAYQTRAAKDGAVDFDEVAAWWGERMDAHGFTADALRDALGRIDGPRPLLDAELAELQRVLLRADGITANEASFDRRSIVQAIASFAEERLPGDVVDEIADRFLAHEDMVRIDGGADHAVIRREDGIAVSVPTDGTFTTRATLRLEARAIDLYDKGREAQVGIVADDVLRATFADPRFDRLSDEQRTFVREFTTSGMQVQAGVGRAGSGKTTSMEAAVAAWSAAGYRVVGAAVGGTQSILLAEEATGESRTVASLLFGYYEAKSAVVDEKTVLLVDEASLLSTHDAALLERMVAEHPGAILRLIGDQEQHSSVAAGGFFRYLVEERAVDVPQLSTVYRQQGAQMAEVRLALDEYREGKIRDALARLERDGKITEAASVDEAYDLVTAAWCIERGRRTDDPGRRLASMTADRHHERLELNRRARAMLAADGSLTGPELAVDGTVFRAGDEVIARVGDHELRAAGSERGEWVRNGALGVVQCVGIDSLVVEFERWGSVEVTKEFIGQEVAPGINGGIMHSYALTTFAAQGATMASAMPLVTDASSRAGTYVGLTRPQFDLNAVVIRYDKVVPLVLEDDLPVVKSEVRDLIATANALGRDRAEQLATASEPGALAAADLAAERSLPSLDRADPRRQNIWACKPLEVLAREQTVGLRGITEAPDDVVEHLGPRPAGAPDRRRWDAAASAIALYRERNGLDPEEMLDDGEVEWALGERPTDPAMAERYDAAAAAIRASLGIEAEEAPVADEVVDVGVEIEPTELDLVP